MVAESLRARLAAGVMRRLRRHQGQLAIAAPVWHELRFGCERLPRSTRRAAIERYLDEVMAATLPVLDYDRRAAGWHAAERARLAAAGATPPFVDGQNAAIARVNALTLITANPADLRGFGALKVRSSR